MNVQEPYKYKIKLPMGPPQYGEFPKSEFNRENTCGCDAFMYVSLLFPPDGSLSVVFAGMDGRTQKDLGDNERWKIWLLLAKELSESEELSETKRAFCGGVFKVISEILIKANQ
jgi:hypothetical protein